MFENLKRLFYALDDINLSDFVYDPQNATLKYFEWSWTNTKWYETKSKDGYKKQPFRLSDGKVAYEIPYKRKIGHPSNGRFAPFNCNEVSYWTNNMDLTWPETRRKKTSNNELGFPIQRKIDGDCKILDISKHDCVLLKYLEHAKAIEDRQKFLTLLTSSKTTSYIFTQLIASFAFAQSIHGVIYRSAHIEEAIYETVIYGKLHKFKPVQVLCFVSFYDDNMLRI